MLARATSVAAGLDGPLWTVPLQSLDPSLVTGVSPTARAAVSFLLTVLVGGAVIYRDGGRIGAAVEASRERPFAAVVYGLMAFGIVAFFVAYGLSQLANLGLDGTTLTVVGGVCIALVLLTLGGLGFAVVGTWAAELFGARDPLVGLAGVGAVSALAWLLFPVAVSVVVWLAIAAVGVGGPARRWLHSSGPTA